MDLALVVLDTPSNGASHHSGIVGVAGDALDSPSGRSEGSLKVFEIV